MDMNKLAKQSKKLVKSFYSWFLKPYSQKDDAARQEFILNCLLVGSLVLSAIAAGFAVRDFINFGSHDRGASPVIIGVVFLFFLSLYLFSRFRYYKFSAYLFILFYFLIGTYVSYRWGIVLAQGWMVYVLVVVMSSVLISTRFGVAMAFLVILSIVTLTSLGQHNIIRPDYVWVTESAHYKDAIGYALSLLVITLVSAVSNREIEKSLAQTKASQALLKKERDQLELRVQERTRSLLKAQREEVLQLHRFAEFGHLATDLLHDLVVPLTSVSLNLKQANKAKQTRLVSRAVKGVENMERFISSARKQIQHQEQRSLFRPADEILLAREVLEGRFRKAHVKMVFKLDKKIEFSGSPIAFHKVVVNLLSNAIDACAEKKGDCQIVTTLALNGSLIELTVKDTGVGISPNQLKKIFTPFFTTKDSQSGVGIGLSVVQEIVETQLAGTLSLTSQRGQGTLVVVKFRANANAQKLPARH